MTKMRRLSFRGKDTIGQEIVKKTKPYCFRLGSYFSRNKNFLLSVLKVDLDYSTFYRNREFVEFFNEVIWRQSYYKLIVITIKLYL
jgi:hypothetical protein